MKAVTNLVQPRTLKDIQSLNGKLATLGRFLSKGAEKSLPFFKALKRYTNKKTIQCTKEAEEAFQKMKKFMEILPTLTAPIKGKVLIMYLVASTESISVVLIAEMEGKQIPVYFVSRVLQGAELNYPTLEKVTLTLIHATRRLRSIDGRATDNTRIGNQKLGYLRRFLVNGKPGKGSIRSQASGDQAIPPKGEGNHEGIR
ncbi:reverse transcriptase domain-containing protein [Tanacetum coccineum]